MKPTIKLLTSLMCVGLWQLSLQGATKYWDIDGATPGAGGATPAGMWDTGTTANWTTDSTGSSAGTTWSDGDDAVFSAGTDATGAFTITVTNASPVLAGNLTVEEGNITFSDYMATINVGNNFTAGKALIDVATNLTLTIDTALGGGDDTLLTTKTGAGTLTLLEPNYGLYNVLVQEGILDNANAGALQYVTTVSNGAALYLSAPYGSGQPVVLNGGGPDNTGALRCTSPSTVTFSAGADLGSDARIQNDGGANFDFLTRYICGTNGGNNFNLILGGNSPGRIRMNQVAPYNRAIDVGTGTVTKEGTCRLQIENPWICSAFYFNGGDIYPRYSGFGQGNIYVGAGANSFMSLPNTSCTVLQPMVLASGANIKFDVRSNNGTPPVPLSFTCDGVISGEGGLTKIQAGTLFLNAANTYSGTTTIQEGNLTLGPSGSISNTTVIDVQEGTTNAMGVFNVTSNANFVLQLSQTLQGNGVCWGNIVANGTIAPGESIGTLSFSNALTVANLLIEVDTSASPSNDVMVVAGALSAGTGTVTVNNLGPTLAVGDTFYLFTDDVGNHKAVSGGGSLAVTGGGATWVNNLAADGSITVQALAPPAVPATNVTIQAVGPTSFSLGGMGAASSAYSVYASTNVTTPMSNWWKIGTTNSSAGGVIQFLDPQATNAQRFYRFGQP